jgi:heme exporter protein D
MYFESLQAALTMGGHGPYVWSAYGITALVILQLLLWPLRAQRRLLRELRGEQRRNSRSAAQAPEAGA